MHMYLHFEMYFVIKTVAYMRFQFVVLVYVYIGGYYCGLQELDRYNNLHIWSWNVCICLIYLEQDVNNKLKRCVIYAAGTNFLTFYSNICDWINYQVYHLKI